MVERSRDLRERAFHILLLLVGGAALASGLFNLLVVGDTSPPTIFDSVLGLAILLVTWLFLAPELAPRLLGPAVEPPPRLTQLLPETEPEPLLPPPKPWVEPQAPPPTPARVAVPRPELRPLPDSSAQLLEAIQRVIDPPKAEPAVAKRPPSKPAPAAAPAAPPPVAGEIVKELDAMYQDLQPAEPALRANVGSEDRRRGRPAPTA